MHAPPREGAAGAERDERRERERVRQQHRDEQHRRAEVEAEGEGGAGDAVGAAEHPEIDQAHPVEALEHLEEVGRPVDEVEVQT